jgi:microsomal epoxide hydrolase
MTGSSLAAGSSIRYYDEDMDEDWDQGSEGSGEWADGDDGASTTSSEWATRTEVPTAIAAFPKDLVSPPRELAERLFDVRRFTTMGHGGHFAALEVPELLAADIRAFVGELRLTIGN